MSAGKITGTGVQEQENYDSFEQYDRGSAGQDLILPIIAFLLIGAGWFMVWYQPQTLIEATMLTHQLTQLEITRAIARSVEIYAANQATRESQLDRTGFEREIFERFIAPVRLLDHGDVWISAPDHVVFGPSSDFPAAYRGKSMAEIFALQSQQGASHYEEMTAAVMKGQEGMGWYIWLPDQGREIAAWTPVSINGQPAWVIGISTPLSLILESTGIRARIWNAYISMAAVTLVVLTLLLVWNNGRRQRDRAEAARERLLLIEQDQRLLAETLARAFLALTWQTDQTKVLDEILNQVQHIVPYDAANIVLLEAEMMHLVRWQGYEPAGSEGMLSYERQPLAGFPLDAEVVQSQQAVVIADVTLDSRWVTTSTSAWIRSFMAVPISLHERVIGLLRINSGTPHRFSPDDSARLKPLAHAAAIALENARLYEQLQQELRERTQAEQKTLELNNYLLAVQYTGAAIASSLDLNYILGALTTEVINLFKVDRCVIYEWAQTAESLSIIAHAETHEGQVVKNSGPSYRLADLSLHKSVLAQRRAQQLSLSQPHPGPAELAYLEANRLKMMLLFPMEAQNQVIGLLELSDRKVDRIFTIDQIALIQQLANQTASAIKNANLYEQATQELAERRKVEKELRESEIKFRILAETTAAVIFIYQHDLIRYVNPAAEAITGYTRTELLAMNFWEVIHPDFREWIKEQGNARLRGDIIPPEYELKILTKAHEERWLAVTLGMIIFEDEIAVLGTAFDITGRKQAEESLRKSGANLNAIFENSRQAFILIDKDYRVLAFNKIADYGIKQISGNELKEGNSIYDYVDVQDLGEFDRDLGRVLQGHSISLERNYRINGLEIWLELTYNPVFADDGQIIGICFSGVDITERKKLIETLAENENRLLAEIQGVLATAHALVTETNLNNLLEFIMIQAKYLTQADGAAVLLLGQDSQQLEAVILGKEHPWFEIGPAAEAGLQIQSSLQFPLKGSLAEQALATQTVQISHQVADDEIVASLELLADQKPVRTSVCAPLVIQGKNLGVLLIWFVCEQLFSEHDNRMMALFANQAALALNNAHLYALNRQLAIEQERQRLARDLHDSVTQSLYSIGMAAETILKRMDHKPKQDISEPARHIHQLAQVALRELREQVQHLHPTAFANTTLAELLQAYADLLRQQHTLLINLAIDPRLTLSPYQRENLYYLVKEALWNAVKYAPGAEIQVLITQMANQVTLSIEDDGPGFVIAAAAEMEMYGLRSMRERAALLGGSFTLESKPGEGTRITAQIPVN